MSAAGDKSIKFTFAVNQQSMEATRGAIRQLTSEVKVLVETLARAGSSMQGLGGMFGGISSKGGSINPSREQTMKGGGILTSGITADAKALSASAKAGSDAMRQMTSSVKSGLSAQISDVQRLRKELDDLNRSYQGMGGGINWGGTSGGGMAAERFTNRDQARDTHNRLAEAELSSITQRNQAMGEGNFVGQGQRVVNRGGIDYIEDEGGGGGGGRRGLFARGGSALASRYGGVGSISGLVRGVLAGGAIAGAYDTGVNAYSNRQLFQSQEAAASLGDSLRKGAIVNQAYGSTGMGVRSNVNTALAAAELSPTELRSALGPEKFNALLEKASKDTGNTGTFSQAKDFFTGGTFGAEQKAKLERAVFDIGGDTAQAYSSAVQQKQQAQNLQQQQFRGNFDSSYMSRMQLMRAAGMGGVNAQGMSKAQLLGIGTAYSNEELAGARAQLRTGVGGAHQGLAESLLNYQNGGLGNAAGLMGAAGGYGNISQFMGTVSRGTSMGGGAGLVDIAASGQLGDLYTGAMMQGDFNTSGRAGMAGLMSTSALFGGDLRSARGATTGYGALSAYSGGQTDRLQQGINVLASVQQGGTLYSQEALRNMSPAQRMDIMRQINTNPNFELPPELKAQGLTKDMMVGYGKTRDKFLFSEYMTAQGTSTTNAAVDSWKREGVGSLKGLKGNALRDAVTNLGVAAFEAKRAPSVEAGKHMIAQLAAEDPSIFKALQNGGIGDVAANSFENEHKLRRDISQTDQETYYGTPEAKEALRKGTGQGAMKLGDQLISLGQDIGASNTAIKRSLGELSEAIATAARDIKQGKVYRPKAKADKDGP